MGSPSFEDKLHDAISRTLSEPAGMLAMAWALNLPVSKRMMGIDDPHVMGDSNQSAYNEGVRRAGKVKLEYLQRFLHQDYQALMVNVLDMQNHEHMVDTTDRKPLKEKA